MGCCGHIINDVIPYVNNAMLAAILSLLIVILFVLLLHVYARWLLGQAHHRRTRASFSMTQIFGPPRRLAQSTTTYTYDVTSIITKGLDRTAVDSIPIFVYGQDEEVELECAICLSLFEERELGRSLPRCSHAFHVGCIDMWLHSHSTCPVCRAQVIDHDHHHHHDRTVEIEDEDDDNDRGESMVEIVVENHDDK